MALPSIRQTWKQDCFVFLFITMKQNIVSNKKNWWKGKPSGSIACTRKQLYSYSFIEAVHQRYWMMPHHWRPLAHEQNSIFKCKQHTCTLHDPWGPEKYDYTTQKLMREVVSIDLNQNYPIFTALWHLSLRYLFEWMRYKLTARAFVICCCDSPKTLATVMFEVSLMGWNILAM